MQNNAPSLEPFAVLKKTERLQALLIINVNLKKQ
jgi:hypothetical protein